jgi:asparagine synthase (glutamine-hydrolysing)
MCRIAGIVSRKLSLAERNSYTLQMRDAQAHGGPDDAGIYVSENYPVTLGHRRLSFLDLSAAGNQPMADAAKKIWISFNGEIYNFKELRSELQALGAIFKTQSDTEVLLVAYEYWGVSSFERLKGMFAFAILDEEQEKLYLVRDPQGIKPLYYLQQTDRLVFASEVKAFHHCGILLEEDPRWKVFFLAFGHIPEPYTTLKNVQHLAKGHYLEWDFKSQTAETKLFYQFHYSEEITDRSIALKLVREKMELAVERHLLSDAPIGVFLSGGIDSSIITLLANQYQQQNLQSLSINLQETDFAERQYQQVVVNQLQGDYHEYLVTYKDFVSHFDQFMGAMDQPSNDGINSWFVCKRAHENGLKAVLSGLGGDELFGGYPSFGLMNYVQQLKKLPSSFLKLADQQFSFKYRRFYYLSYDHPIGEYLFLRGFFTPNVIAEVLGISIREVDDILQSVPLSSELKNLNGGNRASWFETNLYMQNQLLRDTDYMSMSHGLEVRVPFLDRDLMESVFSIQAKIKYEGAFPKMLLIDAFKDVLPEAIWNRKKMGFTFPFQEWMRRFEQVSQPEQYQNKMTKKLMQEFNQGQLHWSNAFALYHVNT